MNDRKRDGGCTFKYIHVHRGRFLILEWSPYIYIYTGCSRENVPDFGRMSLKLKYTDITKNTYI